MSIDQANQAPLKQSEGQPEKKFNLEIYKTEFKHSCLLWCLGLTGIFVLFSNPIRSLLNAIFVQTVVNSCPKDNYCVDIVILLFFISSLWFLIKQLCGSLRPSINSILFSISALIVYVFFFRISLYFEFYFFHIQFLNWLAYWDLSIVSLLIFLATYKSYWHPLTITPSKYSFVDDNASLDSYEDGYSRTGYAKEIASHISKTTTKSSFAISVVGDWGSGKTDFLLRLKDELEKDDNNRLIEFNPWRVSKSDAIIEEFFKMLSAKIKPFNQSITAKIKDYSKRILQTGKEIQYRFFDVLLNEWMEDKDIEKQYQSINQAISITSKRWIIIIDDIDRLTGKEIMEVLRIIRNTANFGNVFFIAAIDQRYVVKALKNANEFANEDEYLKKVFQLVITLPTFKKDLIVTQAKKLLITDDVLDGDKATIDTALSNLSTNFSDPAVHYYPIADHDDILEKMIDSIRDLKRFANSFKIVFNILNSEVDIHDLMVLELIRNRNIEVYNLIRNRRLLDFDTNKSSEFTFNDTGWTAFEKDNNFLSQIEIKKLKDSVMYLVKDIGYKNSRKFISSHNFYLYFSYQLFDLISLKEFNNLLDQDAPKITKKFDEWSNEGKRPELLRITAQLTDFPNSEFFIKMLIVYLNVKTGHDIWLQQVCRLVFTLRQFNEKKYFGEDQKRHRVFLNDLMSNSAILAFDRANIAYLFLYEYNHSQSNTDLVLTKQQWLKVICKLFDQYLKEIKILDNDTLTFLYLNVHHIDPNNDKLILYKPALTAFKNALLLNTALWEGYISKLIRPMNTPYRGNESLVFEPFLEQIFGDWKKFKTLLVKSKFTNELNDIKKIILKNIQSFYTNNGQPFKITSVDESKFVDKWMVKNGTTVIIK